MNDYYWIARPVRLPAVTNDSWRPNGRLSLAILRFVLPSPPLLRPDHLSRQSLKLHSLPGGGRIQRWEHYRLPVAAIRVATAIVTTIRIGGVGT